MKASAPQPTIGKLVDDAMTAIERDNPTLKGVLPKDFGRAGLDKQRLGQIINLVSDIGLGAPADRAKDTLGRVYEYFLSRFASAEGKSGGQFYTPQSVVRVLVEMLAPYKGRVYDPCCGSGGMFVSSEKFIESHSGRIGDISIYGQESNYTTWRLAKMNLAIRGIDAQIAHGDTFHGDKHPDLKADFVLANPPFNDSDWRGELLREDKRWVYGVPPAGNANFAWVQHFIHHLAPAGMAGFVLANGSMSSNQSGEGEIRKAIIEADLVDCMVALPGQLFYSTQIPVCLWFLRRNKARLPSPFGRGAGGEGGFDRRGETLFIDARKLGTLVDRTHRELSEEDLAKIAGTYHAWRGDAHPHPDPLPEGEGNYRGGVNYSSLIETARMLRQQQTPAEEALWEMLRNRKFLDLKFRRQHQFGTFILDFYCDELKLAVELDGGVHKEPEQLKKDEQRDAYLRKNGLTVLRFANEAVFAEPDQVFARIQAHHPSPVGRGTEGEGYQDIPGFCKSVGIEEIRKHGHVLTPGRYVGAEAVEDDGEPFEAKMKRLTTTLRQQIEEGRKLDAAIEANLKELGFWGQK
ncbi:MAG TPA: N-6 DNA methylase [Candidatus Aminicenantes bacterium]|nr:N-6 DNA methylase [Candidatus Aminicenantes bacterium]